MNKGGFINIKNLIKLLGRNKYRLPQQLSISKISKGKSVNIKDINTDDNYVIAVTYPSGAKRVFNDVRIKEHKLSNGKVSSLSFVYNKNYADFKMRDGKSPSQHNITNFSSIKIYYTNDSNPISTSIDLAFDSSKSPSRKSKSTSRTSKSTSRTSKSASRTSKSTSRTSENHVPPFLHKSSGFLKK